MEINGNQLTSKTSMRIDGASLPRLQANSRLKDFKLGTEVGLGPVEMWKGQSPSQAATGRQTLWSKLIKISESRST